ncbi:lipopolysaccharide biosynthesis protein [Xenorhabdus entomophaga]|uniref:lipopolysaccharide biosynthesis protein n=1 Tax=Xenorhabdus entomophaga TaxID=3136257 RepID=UPI0030F4A37F
MLTRIVSLLCIAIQALQGILTIKIAAQFLNISEMKTWVLLAALIPYISIFDFGISQAIIREVSIAKKSKESKPKNHEYTLVRTLLTFSGSVILLLAVPLLIIGLIDVTKIITITCLFIASACLRIFSNSLLALVFVNIGPLIERTIRLLSSLIFLSSIYAFLYLKFNIYSLHLSILSQSIIIIVLSCFISKKDLYQACNHHYNKKIIKRIFPNLRDWTLTYIPSLFVFSSTIYVISFSLAAEDVVKYSIIYQLFFGILAVCNIPIQLNSPKWSQNFARNGVGSFNKEIMSVIFEVSIIALMGCLSLNAFGNEIIHFIKPNISTIGFICFLLFSILIYIESIQATLTSACFSCRETNYIKITAIAGVFSVLFSFLGAKLYGLEGAIGGVLLSQSITCEIFNIKRALTFFRFNKWFIFKLLPLGGGIIFISSFLFIILDDSRYEIVTNTFYKAFIICIALLIYIATSYISGLYSLGKRYNEN